MTSPVERRAFAAAEVRATPDNKIEFRPILFRPARSQDLGGFYEEVAPSAVGRALREADITANVQHDDSLLLGSTRGGTLRLRVDSKGVIAVVDVPNTTVGRDTYELVKRGDIAGASFAFRVVKDSWSRSSPPVRTLEEIDLFDVALVTQPAYLGTLNSPS